jgi:hypothetical protein
MDKPVHKNFSRQQLYQLVWSKPSIEVAQELGISDVMLGKICKQQPAQNNWVAAAL